MPQARVMSSASSASNPHVRRFVAVKVRGKLPTSGRPTDQDEQLKWEGVRATKQIMRDIACARPGSHIERSGLAIIVSMWDIHAVATAQKRGAASAFRAFASVAFASVAFDGGRAGPPLAGGSSAVAGGAGDGVGTTMILFGSHRITRLGAESQILPRAHARHRAASSSSCGRRLGPRVHPALGDFHAGAAPSLRSDQDRSMR
jgi:hypothetical protein